MITHSTDVLALLNKPFDEATFNTFTNELFGSDSMHGRVGKGWTSGNSIPEQFEASIKSYKRLNKYEYTDATTQQDKVLDVLIVNLKRAGSVEQARTLQRNFVERYLNGGRGGELRDAALVAFVSEDEAGKVSPQWRLSLITMEYSFEWDEAKGKNVNKKLLTPAKRASFLVGKDESTHTACKQLNAVLVKAQKERITIDDLKQAFSVEKVSKEFFEKYKDLFAKLHDELERLVREDAKIKADFEQHHIHLADFAKKTLGQLVFLQFLQKKGWLGVKQGQAWGTGDKNFLQRLFNKHYKDYTNFFNEIVEPLFYEALATKENRDFNDLYTPLNCRIPFLNGGLFEPLNGYAWRETDITIDNDIFKAVFDTFNLYNFTVKEDEPLEKEVAVDPEMLGKVFEELLEVKDRKSKGAFYTPREIVHYMCQESLIQYLHTHVSEGEGSPTLEDLRTFIELAGGNAKKKGQPKEALPPSIKPHAHALDTALANITVCDPAIGSGAFPVGMLHELVRARTALTPYLSAGQGAGHPRTPYHLKRHAIENCIYGVDIDPGAIEIAKLRFWLALVVDQELEADQHINPLPNMDYKLLCGNSLLGVPMKRDLLTHQTLDALDEAKHAFFNETDADKKKALKTEINSLKQQLTGQANCFDYHLDFYEVMHGNGGFDVVIGNPPYVRQEAIKELKPLLKNSFKVFNGTADLYTYFYEQGHNILKPNGTLNYITSNKWMRTKYGENLRGFLIKHTHLEQLIDFGGTQIFDTATVDTNILFFSKVAQPSPQHHLAYGNTLLNPSTAHTMPQASLRAENFTLAEPHILALKTKIERLGTPLKQWDVKINRGILTGYNEAFIIDTPTKDRLCAEDPRSAELLKPVLRGRDIQRWQHHWAGLWLIGTFPSLSLTIDDYPAIKRYLEQFKHKLPQTGETYIDANGEKQSTRKKTSNRWFETQDNIAYWEDFQRPKIVYPNMTKYLPFIYDESGFVSNDKSFILTSDTINLKFLVGYFHSAFAQHWIKSNCAELGVGWELRKVFFENIPIPKASEAEQAPLIAKVEAILAHTQREGYTSNPTAQAAVAQLEAEIDVLVYRLYQLTYEEVLIIDPSFSLSQAEYEGSLASLLPAGTPLFQSIGEG